MGIISTIRGWFNVLLNGKLKQEFQIEPVISQEVENLVARCMNAYRGTPDWIDDKDHIKTINFAKALCSETARLATMGIGVHIGESARAEWLQEQFDQIYFKLREWVEYACACGTVILKPNYNSIDIYLPGDYIVTDTTAGEITGVIFIDREADEYNKRYYTRFEYHRFDDNGNYIITNRCKVGKSANDVEREIAIEKTPWIGLSEEEVISNITSPLFAVLRTPHANNVDIGSAFGLPLVSDALEELQDLDVAYSRNVKEIKDSKRTVLLDADRLVSGYGDASLNRVNMPDYVKLVDGVTDSSSDVYHEINPSLNTDIRINGINALLSQIGYKIGFSNGHFVFNQSTGIQTATGVEAEQQRTIQFIKDVRDKLESCLDDLIYALNSFADLYDFAPLGEYEITYDFGDITYNREEDRARWYGYVTAGKVPFWSYLVKFEGYTEEEARELEAAAQPKAPTLFGNEE